MNVDCSLSWQRCEALTSAGVERLYADVMSGTVDDDPGLRALFEWGRVGRTTIALVRIIGTP